MFLSTIVNITLKCLVLVEVCSRCIIDGVSKGWSLVADTKRMSVAIIEDVVEFKTNSWLFLR